MGGFTALRRAGRLRVMVVMPAGEGVYWMAFGSGSLIVRKLGLEGGGVGLGWGVLGKQAHGRCGDEVRVRGRNVPRYRQIEML